MCETLLQFFANLTVFAATSVCSIYFISKTITLFGLHHDTNVLLFGSIIGVMCGVGTAIAYVFGTFLGVVTFASPMLLYYISLAVKHLREKHKK